MAQRPLEGVVQLQNQTQQEKRTLISRNAKAFRDGNKVVSATFQRLNSIRCDVQADAVGKYDMGKTKLTHDVVS